MQRELCRMLQVQKKYSASFSPKVLFTMICCTINSVENRGKNLYTRRLSYSAICISFLILISVQINPVAYPKENDRYRFSDCAVMRSDYFW